MKRVSFRWISILIFFCFFLKKSKVNLEEYVEKKSLGSETSDRLYFGDRRYYLSLKASGKVLHLHC